MDSDYAEPFDPNVKTDVEAAERFMQVSRVSMTSFAVYFINESSSGHLDGSCLLFLKDIIRKLWAPELR